ncbi:NADH dehydrogenase [ubiquinone] 1 beta subcomplex subunit 5, mitochondrial [Osmia bicornis bicornis]|uniref:NADH dehydrogenase [ubiquinone] 1 beta subcomplex subunit 5, mitochondrial n=1 Tax=Osmia bicornis bicornis TaxID=1437191 RepID=UPI0010F6702C|nr:NADH dehydrogenase [ubiquinone] 1 beta subcomplex subunit 5, mitochondrial [Osmia bicornis bicornis]
MAVLSRLFFGSNNKLSQTNGLLRKLLNKNSSIFEKQTGSIRCMSEHRTMPIVASRWQWHKTKDWIHFYFFVGAIPVALIIFYANVFIGPATLEEIPEGYTPQRWEYYRSPITRFLARYVFPNPQQEYEKYLAYLDIAEAKKRLRWLEIQFVENIRSHQDYPIYSYQRSMKSKYIKEYRKLLDEESVS